MTMQAIYLNNTAVQSIHNGDLGRAVEILVDAIDQIQCEMQNKQLSPQLSADEEMSSVVINQVYVGAPLVDQKTDIASSMHCRALTIASDQHDLYSESYYRIVSSVILYNLAFINHSRGLRTGLTSDQAKALKLYEMSIALIHEHAHRSDLQYMAMAILRNMGHIHSCLFHLKEAKACFDSLRHILSNVDDANSFLQDGDYEDFFISAMFQSNELLLAPAA